MSNSVVGWRSLFAAVAGLNLSESKRDYYKVFGYKHAPTFADFKEKYERQDIAGRIVDAPAEALWSRPPKVSSGDANWDKLWNKLVEEQQLFQKIIRLDKLANLGTHSLLFIGTDDGAELREPVQFREDAKVLHLQVYSEANSKIMQVTLDSDLPNYMQPESYTLSYDETAITTTSIGAATLNVHASRILHVAEGCIDDNFVGNPRMRKVYNILDDMHKVVGGTAETYWLTSNRGLHINLDKDVDMTPEDEDNLAAELEEYEDDVSRFIKTRGASVDSLGSDVPDPGNMFEVHIALISGTTGIPKRILIGSEAGQLASTQDRDNWAERVMERSAVFGEPVVLRPLIDKLVAMGVLPKPEKITITWPSQFRMSPTEEYDALNNLSSSMGAFEELLRTAANEAPTDVDGTPVPLELRTGITARRIRDLFNDIVPK